jgi:hypothetical protein
MDRTTPSAGPPGPRPIATLPVSARERRHENRKPLQSKARLRILDGPGANAVFEVLTRDLSLSGVSFVLRQALALGQKCRIEMPFPGGRPQSCEVVRARALSNGRFEMAVQFEGKLG